MNGFEALATSGVTNISILNTGDIDAEFSVEINCSKDILPAGIQQAFLKTKEKKLFEYITFLIQYNYYFYLYYNNF